MSVLSVPVTARSRNRFLGELTRTPITAIVAAVILAFILLAAIWPSLLQSHDPFGVDPQAGLLPPSPQHLFGTDQSGRDIFSRIIEGTRQSLVVGVGATLVGLIIGGLLGITAALSGPRTDAVISRVIEVLYAFPSLLLALLFIAIAGTGVTTLVFAVGIGTAPGYARILRVQTVKVAGSGYLEASLALGWGPRHRLWHTIVPNVVRPLLILATLGVGQAIVWASALSFLGLGAAPPAAEWGTMLADGRNFIQLAWWIAVFPGLAITVTALVTTVLGRYIQRRTDGVTR
ncbi:ABC transporter permease [Mycetocola lacteus]|uniref:ABC transporter permease n=1 Tax=Mycetocola lacteus TaxID=76637 RepID=A0A3L7AUE5_9MICO|nr:ABC transporter permease [Mycetocola lacteus]RLP83128.1 ABC transporter permease [Mycetocola lacteus]